MLLAITASMLLGGQAALASSSKNTFNITVNCNSGAQAHQQASSSSNNVNINVNCSSSGGTPGPQGIQGPRGTPGENATVTIVTTTNQTLPPMVK